MSGRQVDFVWSATCTPCVVDVRWACWDQRNRLTPRFNLTALLHAHEDPLVGRRPGLVWFHALVAIVACKRVQRVPAAVPAGKGAESSRVDVLFDFVRLATDAPMFVRLATGAPHEAHAWRAKQNRTGRHACVLERLVPRTPRWRSTGPPRPPPGSCCRVPGNQAVSEGQHTQRPCG